MLWMLGLGLISLVKVYCLSILSSWVLGVAVVLVFLMAFASFFCINNTDQDKLPSVSSSSL